jgi:acetolactate synthase-1/2/3 large subunit
MAPSASSRTVARVLAEALLEDGVRKVFTLPGSSCLSILDALQECGVASVLTGNESTAVHAAHGVVASGAADYGCAVLSRGPGAINGAVGMVTASDGHPVLLIAGDNDSRLRGRGIVNQDAPVAEMYAALCDVYELTVASQAELTINAIRRSLRERRRSCVLVVPSDVADSLGGSDVTPTRVAASMEVSGGVDVSTIKSALQSCSRPFIIWGRSLPRYEGARNAVKHFHQRHPGVPTAITMRGLSWQVEGTWGTIGTMGDPELNKLLLDSDLVIVVAEELRAEASGALEPFIQDKEFISVGGVEDRQSLVPAGDHIVLSGSDIVKLIDELFVGPQAKARDEIARGVPLNRIEALVASVIEFCGPAAVALDSGQNFFVAARALGAVAGLPVLYSDTQGTMGFAIPAAFGVSAFSGCKTLAVVGDGGMIMTLSELPMIAADALPVTILVLDNQSLGMVKATQDVRSMRHTATILPRLNIAAIAHAFGYAYTLVSNASELRDVDSSKPNVIHVELPTNLELISRGSTRDRLPEESRVGHADS